MRHLMWAVILVTLELTTGQGIIFPGPTAQPRGNSRIIFPGPTARPRGNSRIIFPGPTARPRSEKCNAPVSPVVCNFGFSSLWYRYNQTSGECQGVQVFCGGDLPDFATKEKCITACVR
ncbi:hypothetical protein ACOMHN_050759 [Nucella lapillus]